MRDSTEPTDPGRYPRHVPMTVTGRHRALNSGELTWAFYVLDRFGLPTFFLLLTLGAFWWYATTHRADTIQAHQEFISALKDQTQAVQAVAKNTDASAQKLDAIGKALERHEIEDDVIAGRRHR